MERKLTFFQSFQLVHSKRYVINLDALDIQALINEEKLRQKEKDVKEHYQCICGANKWTLLLPFDNTDHQNPLFCNCQIGDFSTCPNYGCGKFCEDMAEKFKSSWRHQSLQWGRTIKDSVQTNFDYLEDYALRPDVRNSVEEKPWKVFRCRRCLFLCYAENSLDVTDIFITTNIPHIPPQYSSSVEIPFPVVSTRGGAVISASEPATSNKDSASTIPTVTTTASNETPTAVKS